jgi:hypothetical protein
MSAPNQLLSTVVDVLRRRHPDMTPEALVELIMGAIVVDAKRQVSERTFVESLVISNSAVGDGLVRVRPGWQEN